MANFSWMQRRMEFKHDQLGHIYDSKDRLLTSMLCAKSMICSPRLATFWLSEIQWLLYPFNGSYSLQQRQSLLYHWQEKASTWPRYMDNSSKFFTWIMLSRRMGRPPRGEDRKIVFLNASVFNWWKAIKFRFGLVLGSHRVTMYAKTKQTIAEHSGQWSV